jgi:hypothetical protein
MSFPSGYTADTLNRLVWDAGVFSYDVGGTRTYLGIRRDATSFNISPETRALGPGVANGIRHRIAGGRRVISYGSTMDVATMELDSDILTLLVPGATAADVGTTDVVTTVTPPDAGVAIAKGSTLHLPRLTFKLSGTGGYFALEFDYGYVTELEFSSEEGNEGQMSFTLEAEVDPAAVGYTTADPDYRLLWGPNALMTSA